jgi:glycosyltransferase involved in cell wall biosynthesis
MEVALRLYFVGEGICAMKLTVMMLAYNHERFIARAIQSVLDQRVDFDYEIVISDDCSSDRTREIVMDFHRRYPDRIVPVVNDKNRGMMRNFIGTLAHCQRQYVAFLEGDDFWIRQDKLQCQVDFLDAHPEFAICCGRSRILDETGGESGEIYPTCDAGTYTIADILRENVVCTCTSVCRWGLLRSLPEWFERVKLGDWPLHVLLAQLGEIQLMDDVFAVYRKHANGAWSSRSQISRLEETIRMFKLLNEELRFRYKAQINRTISRCYLEWGTFAAQSGSRTEAAKCLINCLKSGGYSALPQARPSLKGLLWFTLFGSWLPAIVKLKRSILGL